MVPSEEIKLVISISLLGEPVLAIRRVLYAQQQQLQ